MVVLLSRIQFALNIGVHYLFPPMSIGISLMLIIMEGLYLKTNKPEYKAMAQFWTKVFALTFAIGVASGFVQVFAFGNNWSEFSRFVGDVFGSALAAEGVFAFFLEAGFIGLLLFGWDRVGKKTHYLSTILVAIGAHFSAIWIIAANSWMQTPSGFKIIGEGKQARAVITEFWSVIFSPSFLDRLIHTLIGCWLVGSFMVLSVCAYYMLKKRHMDFAKKGMKIALIVASSMVVLQLVSADFTARGVAKNQPEKLAAIEGVYKTESHTPFVVFGKVDPKEKKVVGLKIPGLLSLLTYRNVDKAVPGLDNFHEDDLPNVPYVFQFYHVMIYMWGLMVLTALLACIQWWRKKIEFSKWVLRLAVVSAAFPHIANETGWFTAEMGRQPWIVYKVLRTAHAASPSIHSGQVLGSIIMFICIWVAILALFFYIFTKKIHHGPADPFVAVGDHEKVYRDPYSGNETQEQGS